jgi:hypothetical protein
MKYKIPENIKEFIKSPHDLYVCMTFERMKELLRSKKKFNLRCPIEFREKR